MASDRYVRRRMLGEGGAGRVWLVDDRARPGRQLALKELTVTGAEREEAFRHEFATLAGLHHPGLPEADVFEARRGEAPSRFTLELVDGWTIGETVRREGRTLLPELAVEALRALAFLHDFDLIHRDLKPGNLLVRREPKLGCRLVIVDFGLALRGDDPSPAAGLAGTLPYLAPELFANRAASRRTDLYALGAVFHELTFGTLPAGGELPPLPPGLPGGFDLWLLEMLSPDPERRPASAPEALARLNEACGTGAVAETPVTRLARLLSGPPAGREEALQEIWSHLAPAEGPRLVWLHGAPGSGKSRVLRWLEVEAVLRGWQVVPAPASLEDLRARAQEGPTLLLLDDAHAAETARVHLLDRVAREGAAPPLQVVAALQREAIARPALRDLVAGTGTVPTLRAVHLPPLGEDGVRAMACRATGGAVSEERVRWLLRACDGLPARAEALLVEGAWERGGRIRPQASAPPVLAMISETARRWLTCAAVLGNGIEEGAVAALAGLHGEAARAASAEAEAAGLAQAREGTWSVRSGALAAHLCDALPQPARVALHRAAAALLERTAEPWRLATLWAGADDRPRAVAAWIAAAEDSLRARDPAEAAARYAEALRLLGRADPERPALRVRQAAALMRAGMHAAAARASGAAVRLARDDAARTSALALQALALVHAGRFRLALEVAARAAKHAEAGEDRRALALCRRAAGIGLARMGREEEAIPLLEEARRLSQEASDARGEAEVLHTLAACRARLGDPRAEQDFQEAIARHRRDGTDEGQDGKARLGLAVLLLRSGRYVEATTQLEEVRAEAAARGDLGLQEVALAKLAVAALDRGRLDAAIQLAGQAADLALHLGDHNLILVNRCALADAWIRCGRSGRAVALLRETLDLPLTKVEPENVDYARMLLANAWMEAGGGDEAHVRALVEETLDRCRERRKRRPWLMALVIEMERRLATDGAEPLGPVAAEFQAVLAGAPEAVDAEIGIREALAAAAAHLREAQPGTALLRCEEAGANARNRGMPAFAARAAACRGEALEGAGREADAEAAFEEARRLLDQAASDIADPAVRADFLNRTVYASLRRRGTEDAGRTRGRLSTLYDLIRVLNSEPEPEVLQERILDLALRAVRAERGMVLLREDREGAGQGQFSVHVSRNLEAETVRDAEGHSRRIVEQAGEGRSLLALDAGADARFKDLASVSLYRIRSLMCVPLRSRGRILGTVYLDTRRQGRLFTEDDLRFVEAFADQAALAIENARMRASLARQNRQLLATVEARASFGSLVGRSPQMQALYALLEKIADTDLPVLIRGESGTGKELVARAIHLHGRRRRRPFLGENCAAIPEALLESELFGHVRGAFTGADRDRPGLFEQASGGTLFLDEVGDMPASMQARLLRVLEEGKVRRVGSERMMDVDVRVVAATHRDLQREIEGGRFRQDLLYRLQVLTVEIPPLRARTGDIPVLTAHFLERIAAGRGRPEGWLVHEDALAILERHPWPGNVRELQNTLQRLSLLAGNRAITEELIASDPTLRRTLLGEQPARAAYSLRAGEREQVRQALAAARGNRKKAAALLGVSRATLYRKLEQHDL
ncbi:MAG TPA: sigma 54-interacting transcriptional regulator [Candidatus Polarisedimenticolaceae bacterium]|nr:sigma 54-interacting transcriptional regulator [Candidatus Polarisedimenticolaceae bacterium]